MTDHTLTTRQQLITWEKSPDAFSRQTVEPRGRLALYPEQGSVGLPSGVSDSFSLNAELPQEFVLRPRVGWFTLNLVGGSSGILADTVQPALTFTGLSGIPAFYYPGPVRQNTLRTLMRTIAQSDDVYLQMGAGSTTANDWMKTWEMGAQEKALLLHDTSAVPEFDLFCQNIGTPSATWAVSWYFEFLVYDVAQLLNSPINTLQIVE